MEKLNNRIITSYRVVGAKAGEAKAPKIAKDSVSSLSTAKILYGLNDGEISGIVGGAKGIYLENTPLEDEQGNSNFEDVQWDFRSGTIDQEYIEGFPDLNNEIGVGLELKSTTAWIRAISNPSLSAVRVRFSWNGLRKTDTKTGDVSGYKIEYAIDVKTTSGAYVEVLRTFINDKVTGKYERTHRVELPKSSNGWQIRVRRITPNANLDNIIDKMYIEAITEVIDQKFTYPHTTLLGLQYDAKTFSRLAKLSVRAKGKLIKVPTNYNSVSNTYTGVWNGQFKLEYSDNPAWIFYDLVLSDRYGLGRRIDASMVDKWALYVIAQYCDEMVDDGEGGLEKRYSCNVYLQKQEDAYKVLSQLAGIFRGLTYWSGQQLVLSADVPKEPSYIFSRANVLDGDFEYSGTALNDRHTVAKVAWDNPKENFKTEFEFIRDEEAISQFGINELSIAAIGCTSRGQAQRAGLWALKSEQLETEIVSFRTGLEGFNLVVGEIIEVSDSLLAGRENGGRIVAVSSDLKSVTIDRDAIVKVNDFIAVNAKDGKSQRRKVIEVSGRVLTVLTPFVAIEAGTVWADSSTDLTTMLFRVMSVKPDEDNIHTVTAIQYEPLKYDAIDNGADVKPTNISIIKPTNIEAPSSVSLSATYRVAQGQSIATLVIQWSQVKNAVAYSVEWRRNSGNWIKMPNTGNVSAEVDGVYSGDYQVRVKSIDSFDVESNYISSAITNIAGKVGEPKALATIKATGLLFGMALSWSFQAGSEDTNYTEIQTATNASGANTATLGSFSYPTDKTELTGLQGGLTVFYRGRIADKLGNFSAWSQWVSGTTDASADKVLEILTGEITQSQLYSALSNKIDKIDTNKQILDSLGVNVSVINTDLSKVNADITKAKSDIITTDGILNTAKADIITAKGVADTAKAEAAANKVVLTALNTTVGANKTAVDSSIVTLTNKDTALTSLYNGLKSEYDTNKASISSELTTLTNKDISLTSSINSLNTSVGANTSAISTNNTALVAKDKALADSITALTSEYDTNKASVTSSLSTLTTKDTALTTSLNALTTRVGTAESSITTNNTALVAKDTALTNSITSLTTTVGNNSTAISSEATARTNADNALSTRITTAQSKADSAFGKITTAETTIASNTQSIAQTKTDLTTSFKNLKIGGQNLYPNGDLTTDMSPWSANGTLSYTTPFGIRQVQVTATVDANNTFGTINPVALRTMTLLQGEEYTLSWTGIGSGITELSYLYIIREDGSNYQLPNAPISTSSSKEINSVTFTAPFTSYKCSVLFGGRSSTVGSYFRVGNVKLEKGNVVTDFSPNEQDIRGVISTEATARSNADSAITSTITALTTTVGNNKTSITTEASTRASEDSALSTRITATDAIAKNAQSRVGTVETTVASHTGSIASLRTDLIASYTIADTRSTDENPQYYYTNYPRQTVQEFKQNSVFTGVIGSGTYILLETNVKWSSTGGGSITQKAITDDNRFYIRMSLNSTTWKPWVEQEDVEGSAAKVAAAKLALDNRINTTDARITAEKKVSADATSAVASNVTTLTTTVNGHTSSISTQQSSINGLNAQYTVNVDSGGRISGFGLASSSTQSDFAVRADKFYIAPVSGSSKGVIPFIVTTATSTINGTSVPAGTYIQSAYIHNGSIDSAKIKNLAVTSAELANATITGAKIANLAVDTAQIANGAIETAKIGNLAVDTLQIKGNAVTVPTIRRNVGDFSISGTENSTTLIHTASVDYVSGFMSIQFSFEKLSSPSFLEQGKDAEFYITIIRDSTELRRIKIKVHTVQVGNQNVYSSLIDTDAITYATILDNPTVGAHTYKVIAEVKNRDLGAITLSESSLVIMGVKK